VTAVARLFAGKGVGQVLECDGGSGGGSQVQLGFAFGAGNLQHCKHRVAAIRMRRGRYQFADTLGPLTADIDFVAGVWLCCAFAPGTVHAPLQLAQVLHAGDDFLPGITALGKTDAIDQLKIGHLRHKGFAGFRENHRYTGLYVEKLPGYRPNRGTLHIEAAPQLSGLLGGGEDFEAGMDARYTDNRLIFTLRDLVYVVWQRAGDFPQFLFGFATGDPQVYESIAGFLQRHLGTQHEHAQAADDGLDHTAGQAQVIAVTAMKNAETGEQTSLGVTDAAELEYKRAKDLLELAISTFTEPEAVAHAIYLLGNLLFEEADEISKKESEKRSIGIHLHLQESLYQQEYGYRTFGCCEFCFGICCSHLIIIIDQISLKSGATLKLFCLTSFES